MEALNQPTTQIPVADLVKLCAADSQLYCKTFFPRTFRQASPDYAPEMWDGLEDPRVRLLNLICARDGAKTTTLRAFASKRISYGISRTILYVGASERDAIRSVQWLRTQVERNRTSSVNPLGWADTFQLKPGRKWEETQIEIEHELFGHTVWVLGAGITGSLRGINFDDYRPDLIILDDPQTDETASTEEQREKLADLVLGAVKNSLAPEVDEPNAKLAMAITPQHPKDISQQAREDRQWKTLIFPCWTKETMDLPVDKQMSSWEARWPTSVLRADKLAAIERNKLSIFTREKECRITSREKAVFKPTWLKIRPVGVRPQGCYSVLAIDPVPPPSERQIAKGLTDKDFEAHYVWGRDNGEYHLLDRDRSRGHNPSWTVATAFRLALTHRVSAIIVDAVNYQRTLKWILEEEMKRRGIFFSVLPIADGMKKFARITNVMVGLATHGLLHIGAEHTDFAEQFEAYPDVEFDDDLDASALALQHLSNPFLEHQTPSMSARHGELLELPSFGNCP